MKKKRPVLERAPKAYKNAEFVGSKEARPIRIMAEYLYPDLHFKQLKVHRTVIFFGSARIRSEEAYHHHRSSLQAQLQAKIPESKKKEITRTLANLEKHQHFTQYYHDAEDLARLITEWSLTLTPAERFLVCSGGGPGIMEAANKGAFEAGGDSIGLNISLPFEQAPNPYITEALNFEFHYFFMRKFWFAHYAKALIVFPGGFGTMDEMFELLTLIQTQKITKKLPIILYGEEFWKKLINFSYLAETGMINEDDLLLFKFCSDPETAFQYLKTELQHIYSITSPAKHKKKIIR